MRPVFLLLTSAISTTIGQILFKQGAVIIGKMNFSPIIGEGGKINL